MSECQWRDIGTAPKYEPLRLFTASFIDPDFNPSGSVEGQWMDDLGWVGAVWNPVQDVWDTNQIVPTHWKPLPLPPGESADARPTNKNAPESSSASPVEAVEVLTELVLCKDLCSSFAAHTAGLNSHAADEMAVEYGKRLGEAWDRARTLVAQPPH